MAVAGDPTRQQVFYFGSTGGGVWKTDDAGWTWQNISDGFFNTASVGALAVAESDPTVIYAGMGESCIRGNVAHGDGVYRSTDGGRTWRSIGLSESRHIARVRVHPHDSDVVYVAALGHVYDANPERGIYRSKDGGKKWERILYRNEQTGACDLCMDATNPRILYAAMWEAHRTPWSLSSGGPGSGLFKTIDGGDTWVELTDQEGLPRGVKGRIGVAVSPASSDRVWAIVEADEGGLFRSDDGGTTWTRLNAERDLQQRPFYFAHVFADPQDADTVYVGNMDFWKSIDGGRTFAKKCLPHGDHHDLWIDPRAPQRMISGNDGGACVSLNGGDSWSTLYNQPTAEMYHLTTDTRFPYRIYGAQQDNSTICLPSRTDHGAITQNTYYDIGGSECGYIAVHPNDPDIIYAGGYEGMLTRYDHRRQQIRDITVWPDNPAGWGAEALKYRFQWTFPVLLSPHDPNVLYVTGNHVFRSTDEGSSWDVVSPDLTRNDPTKLVASGGPITQDNVSTEYYCTIFAFAESPLRRGVLWAGSDDGLIHVSRDSGKTWENITPSLLGEWALISIIEPSAHDSHTAYVAATRYKLGDLRPYLFKTNDLGRTWQQITDGIPENLITRVIREDPGRKGLLYAGTEIGVYVSLDDGAQWERLQENLPVVPVHDLVVKGDDLVAATHGRSFWVLDDVTPLRQIDESVLRARVHLFKPRTTERLNAHPLSFRKGGPRVYGRANTLVVTAQEQRDGPPVLLDAGQNPPDGVIVHYFLTEKPSGDVKVSFLDADGHLIREFSSRTPQETEGDVVGFSLSSTQQAKYVSAEPGANRFIWNLRYPDAREVPGAVMWHGFTAGPMVLPGTYQVRLTVDGAVLTQSFEIVEDPRVVATDSELKEQLELLLGIRDKITEVHTAVLDVRDIRGQLQQWVDRVSNMHGDDGLIGTGKELAHALNSIEEELIQWRAHALEDTLNYPIRLNNKLATLADMVSMTAGPATKQTYELFSELCARTDVQLSRLREVKEHAIPAFADGLRQYGVPLIASKPAS